jgi:hypothetical protein
MQNINKIHLLFFLILLFNNVFVFAQAKQDTTLLNLSLKYVIDTDFKNIVLLKKIPCKMYSFLKKEKIDFSKYKTNMFNLCIDCPFREITAIVKIKDIFFIHYYHNGIGGHSHLLICKESCSSFIVLNSFAVIDNVESFRFFVPKILDYRCVKISNHY